RELAGIVPEACSIRFWHDISVWAFRNGYQRPLSVALEFALQNPSGTFTEAVWQRINIMHRSVRGNLQEHELLHYISLISVLGQLMEFVNLIVPRLKARGSWTPEAERLLASVASRLEQEQTNQASD